MRTGVAFLTGIILIAVIIYSAILLIRQKNEAKERQQKKTATRDEGKISEGNKDLSGKSRREDPDA